MVKFIKKDPNDVTDLKMVHRGRVSYPIIKGFMESGLFLAQLDRTGMQQSMQALYSTLGAYVRKHNMPIKIFSRNGELHLMRLDIDQEGNAIPNWDREETPETGVRKITPAVITEMSGE